MASRYPEPFTHHIERLPVQEPEVPKRAKRTVETIVEDPEERKLFLTMLGLLPPRN